MIQIDLPIQMVMFHFAMLVITITGSSSGYQSTCSEGSQIADGSGGPNMGPRFPFAEEHSRSKTHAGLAKPGSFGVTMEVPLARWMVSGSAKIYPG